MVLYSTRLLLGQHIDVRSAGEDSRLVVVKDAAGVTLTVVVVLPDSAYQNISSNTTTMVATPAYSIQFSMSLV